MPSDDFDGRAHPPRPYNPAMTHAPLSEQYVEFMARRDKYGPTPDGGNR